MPSNKLTAVYIAYYCAAFDMLLGSDKSAEVVGR